MSREQYVATDKATGVEVAVTGEFPPHPDDRMRIARTTTLFTRLISTLLAKDEADRRSGFRAIETQLELADALIRQDMSEVRRLVRETMESMGVTQEQLDDLARQLRDISGLDEATAQQIANALGVDPAGGPPDAPPPAGDEPPDLSDDDVIDLPPPAAEMPDADAPQTGAGSEQPDEEDPDESS